MRDLAPPVFLAAVVLLYPSGTPAQEPATPQPEAVAADELVTDRPDVTESANVMRSGVVQVETGLTLESDDAGQSTLTFPGTLVRIGAPGPLEARVGWAGWSDAEDGPAGAGDAELGLKLSLRRSATGPDLALLAGATVPVGEEPFGSDGIEPEIKAIAAFDLASRVGLGLNAGIAWPESESRDARDHALSWSSSFGIDLSDRLGAFLEYFAESVEGQDTAHSADGGLTLLVHPDLQLDASAGVGLGGPAADWFLGTGLAFRFQP